MPAEDEAESTTKATVSEGEIEIRDKENQKQDIAGLNRDTQNALNKLGEIFDKDSIEERQELAGLFGELAYKAVGDLAEKNGWKDGSAEKNALHAFVGGIMAELGGSDFMAGASGAMVNEMVQKKLAEAFKDDPAMHQWASTLIGGVVSEIVSGNAQAGASTAASGTKNNILSHEQEKEKNEDIKNAGKNRQSAGKIMDEYYKWEKTEGTQQDILVAAIQDPGYIDRLNAALLENPDLTEFEGVILVGVDMYGNEIDARKPENRDAIINSRPATVRSIMNGLYDVAIGEALGVAEDSKVVKDLSQKYQWAVYAKTGIKYVRKIGLINGATLIININEAYKNMSDDELMFYIGKEIGKTTAGVAGGMLAGSAIGTIAGPGGSVVGAIAGVFVGEGF